MTTKTIEKKVDNLTKEVATLRSLVVKVLAVKYTFESDSFENYKNSKAVAASFKQGLKDWQAGRVQTGAFYFR